MITVKRENLKKVVQDRRVVEFDPEAKHGKITGSRFLAVLGKDKYMSDFRAACLIARVFYDDTKTKYTEAGEFIEPIIRSYVRSKCGSGLDGLLDVSGELSVEEPVDKKDCYYDHFRREKIFGGMVDGYVDVKGRRYAILEIKTSSDRSGWFGENGEQRIPEGYYLQASLYAQLSNLDKILFAVGFLEEADYDDPGRFVPNEDNTLILCVGKKDITEEMKAAEEWYRKYIEAGVTPEWTDADNDLITEFISCRITDMPGEAQMLFRKYIKYMDSEEDLSDLEYSLMEIMERAAVEGVENVIYEQNGVRFLMSLRGVPKLIATRL